MLLRWISALIGIALFLGLCLWGMVPFSAAVVLLAALGLSEMLQTYRAKGIRPNPLLAILGLAVPAIGLFHSPLDLFDDYNLLRVVLLLPVVGLFLALVWEVARAARTGEMQAAQNVGYGLLCGVYVSLFGGMVWLRAMPGQGRSSVLPDLPTGVGLLLLAACCVWATDSFALFVGKALGRRKLAPKLSPGKTVEGAVGGFAAALLAGAGMGWLLLHEPVFGLLVGMIAGVFGQIGDLFESALKREAGIKDFGSLMPGHGGVLDRFDSLLFVAPLTALLVCLSRGFFD